MQFLESIVTCDSHFYDIKTKNLFPKILINTVRCRILLKNVDVGLIVIFRDAQGQTPFMLAISTRSYPAALEIFEYITQLPAAEQQEMIFPKGSNPDHSPLHVICCNDTCSFTWTGTEHINQVQLSSNLYTKNVDIKHLLFISTRPRKLFLILKSVAVSCNLKKQFVFYLVLKVLVLGS